MDSPPSLANHFLIAVPGMDDPNFSQGVALLCHHDSNGAMGLMLNRRSDFVFGEVLAPLGIQSADSDLSSLPVLVGGPVAPERGFVLHSPDGGPWDSTYKVSEQIHMTTSRDILDAIANGNGPERMVMVLGYAGWGAHQLEDELKEHLWLSVAAKPEIVFETELDHRWNAATRLIGIDPAALAGYSGHA